MTRTKKYVWYHSRDVFRNVILSRTAFLDLPERIRNSPEMQYSLEHGEVKVIADHLLKQNDPCNLFCGDPIDDPPEGS